MDLILNVTRRENTSVLTLVKKMCKLNCRIDADFRNGLIKVKNLKSDFVEEFFEENDRVFEIDNILIVPGDNDRGEESRSNAEAVQEPDDDYAGEDNLSDGEAAQEPDDDYVGEDNLSDGEAAQEPDDDYAGEDNLSDGEAAQEPDDDYAGEENFSDGEAAQEPDDDYAVPFEDFFKDAFADTLVCLNKSVTVEKKIYDFFEAIDFCQHDIVIVSFIRMFLAAAFEVSDITIDSICLNLKKQYGDLYDMDDIKDIAVNKYSEWLDAHPIFKEKYPNSSIIDVIKVFVNEY